MARMRALLRRCGDTVDNEVEGRQSSDLDELVFGTLHVSRLRREVTLGGNAVELTTNEFELLWLLASGAGTILSRDVTLSALRGIGYDGLDRSIDNCISRLRRKLGDSRSSPTRIKTVRSKGYLFVADAW